MRTPSTINVTTERLCYSSVIAAVDFLYIASEPYDTHVEPPDELKDELENIVARLASSRFAPVFQKLSHAYIIQRRNETIARIFERRGTEESFDRLFADPVLARVFGDKPDLDGCIKALRKPEKSLDMMFLQNSLGFSEPHKFLYDALFNSDYRVSHNSAGEREG
jgi:hypothetical protein